MAGRSERTQGEDDAGAPGPVGDVDPFDPDVGPHSPAADDVSLSATDVTTPGVIAGREEIESRERAAQASPPGDQATNPDHPRDDPHAAEVADRRDIR